MSKIVATLACIAALVPLPTLARDVSGALKSFSVINIKPWLKDPAIIDALREQNDRTADWDQARIDDLDAAWREASSAGTRSRQMEAVMSNPVTAVLRDYAERSGYIVEIILMDAKGLNVGATRAPSDFWQGDEPKYQNTFLAGPDGVDTGEVEYDESAGVYAAQISLPVADPASGELLGAITVGVSTKALD